MHSLRNSWKIPKHNMTIETFQNYKQLTSTMKSESQLWKKVMAQAQTMRITHN